MGSVCSICNPDPDYGPRLLALTAARLQSLSGMAAITVLSRYMAQELIEAGLSEHQITVIPPFVDALSAPDRSSAPRHHLLAGRLAPHKGVQVALDAALGRENGLPLVVAGAGPLEEAVRRAAATAHDRVQFVGWADRAGISRLLGAACSLWLPSLWAEPFGIIGLEALAAGVPVIATPVGGIKEWLDQDGLLVQPGDARALASAADHLETDPLSARCLGERGRTRILRDYSGEALVSRFLSVLHTVARS